MNQTVEKILELGTVRQVLAGFAETSAGADSALGLHPSTDPEHVRRLVAETTEARRLIDEQESWSFSRLPDLSEALSALRVEGRVLDVSTFVDIARFASAMYRARDHFDRRTEIAPRLSECASSIPGEILDTIQSRVQRVIDLEQAQVRDDASPELAALRARSRKLRARIERLLSSVLSNRDHARLLQEPIVTQRNERHVVPVKAESKSQFPGIAHGASASGATVFIEPSAVVEPGNELAALSDRERAEIRRILRQLAEQVRQHRSELEGTSEAAAALDLAQAKGRLSEACNAAAPSISDGTELHLNDARHPLLVPRIAERAGAPERSIEPVPLSFRLDLHRRGLVLTGPNTGGKTVALKTAGLLSLMVQSGMHVPASSSSVFPVFRSIFADIGDDQSISASLSTFSAHLARVVEIDRELELPAMVILDEVGTGTDPSEGGALGCALVEHFLDRRAFVLASTHHGLLKAFAMTGEGVGAASFEFDPRSYEPTYQLVEGAAGRSLAFEIAERLGLPKSIVARARALQDERDRQVGELARRLENESERLDEERRRVERERKALDEERSLLERKDEQARETRSRELSAFRETLEEELRRTRHQLSELVEQATLAADELDSEARRRRKDLKDLEKTVAAKMEAVVAPLLVAAKKKDEAERPVAVSAETEAPLGPGTRVLVASFGMEGEIAALADDHADVLVRDKRLRLPLRELEALPHQSKKTAGARSHTSGGTSTPAARSVPVELNLIGCTVEEAIERADKFLDDALLADHQQVRLIHGHGTGRLRNALNGWLETHPQVERLDNENRGGVTVVELKG